MEKNKMISIGVFAIGLLGLIVSAVWDYINTGTQTAVSIGTYQYAGIAGGMIIAIVGVALLVVKKKPAEEKKE